VPKRIADDDDTPRRRRGAKAVAVEADAERGLLLRLLLHSPKDMVAGALAVAAIGAIVTNALFLQPGPHPSPMFGSVVTLPAPASPSSVNPLPRPRPAESTKAEAAPLEPKSAEARSAEAKSVEARPVEVRPAEPRVIDTKPAQTKAADPLTNLVKATNAAPAATSSIPRPPASIPLASHTDGNLSPGGSRRVAAVQRALTEYGYGQLKPTGTIGSDTQAAIAKFERERKIPATGQMTDRMVRELSAMIGHAID
jgi:outer membrane biosynthesis protein TonB